MTSIPLMRAVIDCTLFIGLSEDNIIQPDAAIQQLESIALNLQELTLQEKSDFLMYIRKIANEEESESGKSAKVT